MLTDASFALPLPDADSANCSSSGGRRVDHAVLAIASLRHHRHDRPPGNGGDCLAADVILTLDDGDLDPLALALHGHRQSAHRAAGMEAGMRTRLVRHVLKMAALTDPQVVGN